LILSEKNEIVTSYKEIEKRNTYGGGNEDPYAKYFQELVVNSAKKQWVKLKYE
jgi:hypothetical protein